MGSLYKILRALVVIGSITLPVAATASDTTEVLQEEELQWELSGFDRPEISYLDFSETYFPGDSMTFTHQLPLTLVMFRETGWTRGQVEWRIKYAAEVYKQCGIKVSSAKLVVSDPLNERIIEGLNFGGRSMGHQSEILSSLPSGTTRPVMFFIGAPTKQDFLAWAYWPLKWWQKPIRPFQKLLRMTSPYNTAWINNLTIGESPHGSSVIAHEVAHLLCRCGHVDERNLLGKKLLNNQITPAQCNKFKKSKLLTKIPVTPVN